MRNGQSAAKSIIMINIIELRNKGYKLIDISKELNISYSVVRRVIKKAGLSGKSKPQPTNMNDSYFTNINNEFKAYFLGLLHADGSIYTQADNEYSAFHGNQTPKFSISLVEQDKYLLEILKKELNLESKIYTKQDSRSNRQPIATVSCAKQSFVNTLLDLKSNELIDKVPFELRRHFIRGYFDGNGSIWWSGTKSNAVYELCGSLDIIDKLFTEVEHLFSSHNCYTKNTTTKAIRGKKIEDMYAYLYNNCKIFMQRKFIKFNSIIIERSLTTIEHPNGMKV